MAGEQRRLDIYGDSITAGNQINPVTCQPDWAGTYGRLLCEDFGANCTCAAISGKASPYVVPLLFLFGRTFDLFVPH